LEANYLNHEYLTNVPLDEAVSSYLDILIKEGFAKKSEIIDVTSSFGRITSKAVYAKICSPHYNSCAMDGIAIKASLTFGATETTPVTLNDCDYTRVDTGDPLPENCDSVIMIEEVVELNNQTLVYLAASPWQNIRQIGEDICLGDMLLPSFTQITPSAAGALIAGGVQTVDVLCKPIIGIIPTGDEIVYPTASPKIGDIMEFNSTIFSGMLLSWGAIPKPYPIVKDNKELIMQALKLATSECDIVLINAGSSAGREDYSASSIANLGKVIHHGIAIKPGKPAILAIIGNTPVIGVPGYPVSGIIVLEALVRPIVNELLSTSATKDEYVEAVLSRRLNSPLKYREFVRTKIGNVNGNLVAVPLNRGAGMVTSFVKADGIIDISQNSEGYEPGDRVKVRLLRTRSEIDKMLVITGSHDPLIDEVSDLLRKKFPQAYTASSHVGSMGGIMAIKRGETHMAGVHLLHDATGEYNLPLIKMHFPNGGVSLRSCVKREQGFILPKGNPFNVSSWSDIVRLKLRYVNRQKGSGTRILCDYLLNKNSIHSNDICDYAREEFTHTSVAAIISSGSADVGLGIYSAAKIYGLDFVPICEEQYDFLIADWALQNESVNQFLDTLSTNDFADRLAKLGGYK
jgi:putative molybdopterin biosynthesis protein